MQSLNLRLSISFLARAHACGCECACACACACVRWYGCVRVVYARAQVASAGGLEHIFSAMDRHLGSPAVQERACLCIRNLATIESIQVCAP
jgi:hypothetical protein